MRIAISVDNNLGENSPVAYRFARAPFFAIVDVENGQIKNIQIIQNPNVMARGGAGPAVAQWLASMGVNVVIASRIGPNAAMALSSMGIQMRSSTPGTPVRQALIMHGFIGG
ncbi:MAG: NifB/NifX family molybdenum-iron cluster-binding protein [Candidatus Njordarchaeota archaeon]